MAENRENRTVTTDAVDWSKLTKFQLNATLLTACTIRDLRVARQAIENGANANCRRPDLMTPLHVAAEHGDVELMTLLCSVPDIKPEAKTMHGLTPLHTAALLGNTEVIQELLRQTGAVINCKDNLGRYPLHYAALQNNLECARFLIRSGAYIHVYDAFQESPLHISVLKTKNLPMTRLLAGWKLRSIYRLPDFYSRILSLSDSRSPFTSNDSQPLLLEAVLSARDKYDLKIVKTVIHYAGDIVNIPDPIGWRTPLHAVAMTGYYELAEYLIDIGADVNAKNRAKQTPMEVALNCKNFNIIRLIEDKSTPIDNEVLKLTLAEGQQQ